MTEYSTTFRIGGDLPVNRMGFGAMRITGPGVWGMPPDEDRALAVCRRAVELGINLIDTADAYGPNTSEMLLARSLAPYNEGLVIATKGGLERGGPNQWSTNGRPEHLRSALEGSLSRLGVDAIDLYQLHAIDDDVPLEDSVGELSRLQEEGKIRHIGVSNFSVAELERARELVQVATVQNRYNIGDRAHEPVVDYCDEHGIGFIPWYPLATGTLAESVGVVSAVADELGAKPGQVALAWLLHRSNVVLPIPGTSSIAHLEENWAAREVRLSPAQFDRLDALD